jgi:hypothetical protein
VGLGRLLLKQRSRDFYTALSASKKFSARERESRIFRMIARQRV